MGVPPSPMAVLTGGMSTKAHRGAMGVPPRPGSSLLSVWCYGSGMVANAMAMHGG